MDIFYQLIETFVLLTIIFLFCGSMFIRLAFRGHRVSQDLSHKPTVTVIMSCFNEGESVYETIRTVVASDYPLDLLKVIAVDDCSKDDSWKWMQQAAKDFPSVIVLRNEVNLGKSKSLLRALKQTDSELILNIDSDGALHPKAIQQLASTFIDPQVGACGGNIMVRNSEMNLLTQLQTLQYNTVVQSAKVGETFSGSVNCISGALFMVRRVIYVKIAPDIQNRSWLGLEVKEGEDRFMTNLILNLGYKTIINSRAKVFTDVPSTFNVFFSQQLRWRRGFFRTLLWILKPGIVYKKINRTSAASIIRLYLTSIVTLMMPLLIVWILMTGGILALIAVKLYLIMIIVTIHGIAYFLAKRAKDPISLGIMPFIILPLWMLIDLTLITSLAALTLTSSSWETRI